MQNSTEEDFLTKTNLNDTILNTTKKSKNRFRRHGLCYLAARAGT